MGTAASTLDEVQPPADWQPSSNEVGFRLISPTSDISDPSCRIQQHRKANLPSSHLTPTIERRRTSKVVARNLPPRPRTVPTPSSFYFPTRASEELEDRQRVDTNAYKASDEQNREAKRPLSKTKEVLQKRALQAKQCLVACVDEPKHRMELYNEIVVEREGQSKENAAKLPPNNMKLEHIRLSTDTTRSLNAAVSKGDSRKVKKKSPWETRIEAVSESIGMKSTSYEESRRRMNRTRSPVPFEPVYRESNVTNASDIVPSARSVSTPVDPMFHVDIALHHEELYFRRLSAGSNYGVSPGVVNTNSIGGAEQSAKSTPHVTFPKSMSGNANKEAGETEIDSPVVSLFVNELSSNRPGWKAFGGEHPDDEITVTSTSIYDTCNKAKAFDVATERKSNVSLGRFNPSEAEKKLWVNGSSLPSALSTEAVAAFYQNNVIASNQETHNIGKEEEKLTIFTRARNDSPFKPRVGHVLWKPDATHPIGSADYFRAGNPRQNPNLSSRSFDDRGNNMRVLPNSLTAANLCLNHESGTSNLVSWKAGAFSPADESIHSSMMVSPGPLLTDQVLCNAAFLFSPSYVGGVDRLQPILSRQSKSSPPSSNIITTHGSRSHLPDCPRRSHPPITIPISDSQQMFEQRCRGLTGVSRGGSLDSNRRVRFSTTTEAVAQFEPKKSILKLQGRNALIPALKNRLSDDSVELSRYSECSNKFSIISESVLDQIVQPHLKSNSSATPQTSSNDILSTLPGSEAKTTHGIQHIESSVCPPLRSAPTVEKMAKCSVAGREVDGRKKANHTSAVNWGEVVGSLVTRDVDQRKDTNEKPEENGKSKYEFRSSLIQDVDERIEENETLPVNSGGVVVKSPPSSMYWSYRSIDGERCAVTPMLGKKSASVATNSPFLRFKAAKNRFSNPQGKELPARKALKKFTEGIVSSRVSEIDGRQKHFRPRSVKKMASRIRSKKRDSLVRKGEMVEKPVFRNPVIMSFRAVSSVSDNVEEVNSDDTEQAVSQKNSRHLQFADVPSPSNSNDARLSFTENNKQPIAARNPSQILPPSSSTADLLMISTPSSSVGSYLAFESTPVSPDHSEATEVTKEGTLRTPLQHNPNIISSLKISLSSAHVSPEGSTRDSFSIQASSAASLTSLPPASINSQDTEQQSKETESTGYERRDTIASNSSEDVFATFLTSHGPVVSSPLVSDSSNSQEESEIDPFLDELIRGSGDGISKSGYTQSERSLQSDAASSETSRFFYNLRRDESIHSLAAESRRSIASGSTTLSAMIEKENLTYLPFRAEAPVKPAELHHHATPGTLYLSPLQRTPMQASKWRTLAEAAHQKRQDKKNQSKLTSTRNVLSERISNK